MELLAPAGSKDALIAAVQSGADAVYIGGIKFSARGSAQNFSSDEMKEWIDYCHLRGVSVHVAANILIKEKEVKDFIEYIGFLNKIGVDAVIIQDVGLATLIHKIYPDLELHASTQLTCASVDTAKALEKAGFRRIVLARELSLDAIKKIVKSVNAQIEVFVHGAICMSYSGQCLMSSIIGGRSGNRGLCAQPCRLSYKLQKNGKDIKSGYLLSPKDMCLIEHLSQLEKIGVTSLKIEGRLKRPEYVSTVVGVYKDIITSKKVPTTDEKKLLLDAFNRSGFTDGYFTKNFGKHMMSYENPSNISENKFSDEAKKRCESSANFKKISIKMKAELRLGEPFSLEVIDKDQNSVFVKGEINAETANNKPITKERIKEQLAKLGATVFESENTQVLLDDGVTVPISEINNVRRKACELLAEKRISTKVNRVVEYKNTIDDLKINDIELTAKVRTKEQAIECINSGIKEIYAPSEVIEKIGNQKDINLIKVLPPVDNEEKKKPQNDIENVLISSLGQAKDKESVYADFRLNVFNSNSIEFLKDFKRVTLSPELTINEIKAMKKPQETEVIAYGRIPLMVYENCPKKANGVCDKNGDYTLVDRMRESFPMVCAPGCFCELLNSKPIFMADKIKDLKNIGIKYLRLDFSVENKEECKYIIDLYKRALMGEKISPLAENTFTRGHFYKSVL